MKPNILSAVIILIGSFFWGNATAQVETGAEEKFKPHHVIGLAISHAHVFAGQDADGNKMTHSLPSLGIDYTYQFHPRWGIGLHTDLILEEFIVEKQGGEEVIERSYPVAPAFMGIYKASPHWTLLLGAGVEFEPEENFFLNRAGVEYSAELPKDWEVFGSLSYDFKWNGYDTWVVGIGISKSLFKHSKEK
jgi:opacity protein-like surface antigen